MWKLQDLESAVIWSEKERCSSKDWDELKVFGAKLISFTITVELACRFFVGRQSFRDIKAEIYIYVENNVFQENALLLAVMLFLQRRNVGTLNQQPAIWCLIGLLTDIYRTNSVKIQKLLY